MSGHKTRLRYDLDTKEFRVQYSDPIQPFLDDAKHARDREESLGTHRHQGLIRIGSLPMTEVLRIKEKWGIDMTALKDKAERRLAMQIIEREYPYLKTTNMRLG
jgi:hypothetical protein